MEVIDKRSAAECVHCHLCRKNCDFLNKYGIDIGDVDRLRELAYHCFLCGKCTEVCPVHIDGRETVLEMRRERAASAERAALEKQYKGTVREKRNYRFRNWKHVTGGTVFFPGCNFPSLFPKTADRLSELFREHGIGTVYECCGKPIAELGFKDDEERIIEGIRSRLAENDINEIVVACPNCREFFGERLGIRVTSVYTKLQELGLGNKISSDIRFFLPCPDRKERIWISEIRPFIDGEISFIEGTQCCGLGGHAIAAEKEISAGFADRLINEEKGQVYAYCASCTGRFRRNGLRSIDHIITLILGTNEAPDTTKSYINRVITKFK